MTRLQIKLDFNEAQALARWAADEMRDPRDQIRWMIREALIQRGMLPCGKTPGQTQSWGKECNMLTND